MTKHAARKIFLLPLTAHATLNAKLVQAAVAQQTASGAHGRVAFRVARGANAPKAETAFVHQLRDAHHALFAEASDYIVDFSKPKEVAVAMEGCDGLVLSTAPTDPNLEEIEMNLVDAAKLAGSVEDILKVSCPQGFLGGDKASASSAVGAQHCRVEQYVKEMAFKGNVRFVRPNTMMDTFLQGKMFEMICGRSLSVSVKNGRVAFVHPLDVADVLAVLLTKPANAMGIPEQYALTGPEALSFQEIAELFTQAVGQRVAYTYFPLWAVQPSMWIRGESPDAVATEIQTARAIESGAEQQVVSTVEDVLGKQPRSFRQFLQENDGAWPLRAYK